MTQEKGKVHRWKPNFIEQSTDIFYLGSVSYLSLSEEAVHIYEKKGVEEKEKLKITEVTQMVSELMSEVGFVSITIEEGFLVEAEM